ncbi:MAG: hypothetical protein LUI01_03290 [Firmicutes bacterium]|nr:hypothetical protein [Bacillota bacterium]
MNTKEIHEFARRWYDLFADESATGYQLCNDTTFADACFSFGFEMDCGNAFIEAFPGKNVFNDKNELAAIIDSVTDVALLGSAVFSQWRYYNHWSYSTEDITNKDVREWFMTALNRLQILTAE